VPFPGSLIATPPGSFVTEGSYPETPSGRFALLVREQASQLAGASHRVVPVTVVHDDVRLRGMLRERLHFRNPFLQLLFGVVVAESFGSRASPGLPGARVAPVEAHHGQVLGGHF